MTVACGPGSAGGGGGHGERDGGAGDGSGLPPDVDSDADTISDMHEGSGDTDGDGIADYLDTDSDNDGVADLDEAGDADLRTFPVDTDGDFVSDYLDTDSDNDGLSDTDEIAAGTSPIRSDTDADGVPDLVELLGCPAGDSSCVDDPLDPTSSPRTRGDFFFLEPYEEPPTPARDALVFSTSLQVADVYFLMDTTGSMDAAIDSLKAGLSTPGTGIIDRVRAEIPDVWVGVGQFHDYNQAPWGQGADFAYRHVQDLTEDAGDAQAAVDTLSAYGGGDRPEASVPAIYATVTGAGLAGNSDAPGGTSVAPRTDCSAGHWGHPCFREGAIPIVALISDAAFHNGPERVRDGDYPDEMNWTYDDGELSGHAPTYAETIAALTDAHVRVLGIPVGSSWSSDNFADYIAERQADYQTLARDTGSVDSTGRPLLTNWTDGAIGNAIVDQLTTLANWVPIDISAQFVDDPSDAVDSRLAFVDRLAANTTGDASLGCEAHSAEDTDADGYPDTFRDVLPGTLVCFDVIVKQNDTVEPTPQAQLFRGTVVVLGDGFTELDSRDVFFLVPPAVPSPRMR